LHLVIYLILSKGMQIRQLLLLEFHKLSMNLFFLILIKKISHSKSGFEVGVVQGFVIVFLRSLHSEIIAVMQMTHQLQARRELEQVHRPWSFVIKRKSQECDKD
jgi:hypothetical protein